MRRAVLRNVQPLLARRAHSRHFSAGVLVVADHDNKALLDSTLATVTAASKLGGNVTLLVAGDDCKAVGSQASSVTGVAKVLVAENAAFRNGVAENLTNLLGELQSKNKYSHIVATSNAVGRSFLPRLGAKLDVQPVTDVVAVQSGDTFVRPIYAGNALSTVQSLDAVKLLSVRATAFDKATKTQTPSAVEPVSCATPDAGLTKWLADELSSSDMPELTSAKVVVSGGRGMKNGDNFKMLQETAGYLGGAVGASRAAVDAGFVPNELQVGQTGKIVAPELYIAVGISGAIQHLAGMKDSKTIVAINKDPEAPIFQAADFGLVADLFTAVPELNNALKARKK